MCDGSRSHRDLLLHQAYHAELSARCPFDAHYWELRTETLGRPSYTHSVLIVNPSTSTAMPMEQPVHFSGASATHHGMAAANLVRIRYAESGVCRQSRISSCACLQSNAAVFVSCLLAQMRLHFRPLKILLSANTGQSVLTFAPKHSAHLRIAIFGLRHFPE